MSTCALPSPPASRPTEWITIVQYHDGFGLYDMRCAAEALLDYIVRDGPPPRRLRIYYTWLPGHTSLEIRYVIE